MEPQRDFNWWTRRQYGTCLLLMVGVVVVPLLVLAVRAFISGGD